MSRCLFFSRLYKKKPVLQLKLLHQKRYSPQLFVYANGRAVTAQALCFLMSLQISGRPWLTVSGLLQIMCATPCTLECFPTTSTSKPTKNFSPFLCCGRAFFCISTIKRCYSGAIRL